MKLNSGDIACDQKISKEQDCWRGRDRIKKKFQQRAKQRELKLRRSVG